MEDYRAALEELYRLRLFGTKLGLNNIRRLLELLGNPERDLDFYHIAGTNGKGSTAAILQRLLMTTRLRVGLFTSPHLDDFRERIRIGSRPISPGETAAGVREILPLLDRVARTPGCSHPTYFEAVTALACRYFCRKGAGAVVWEVGLGGRLDATNAVTPRISVITTIGLEHQAYLGKTLDRIAREKGGIVKRSIPLVTAVSPGRGLDRLRRICRSRRAPLVEVKKLYRARSISRGLEGQVIAFSGPHRSYPEIFLPLPGDHQVSNCLTALAAWERGDPKAGEIPPGRVRTAVGAVAWPGRFEYFPGPPEVIVDGAHNRNGARVLAATLRDLLPGRPLILIIGVLGDKDAKEICRPLLPLFGKTIAVTPPSARALAASRLARIIRSQAGERKIPVLVRKSLESALAYCYRNYLPGREGAGVPPVICVTGSLRLIGPARKYIFSRPGSKQ
ncbi:MAG: folylpolyglutamate synthase/dihydrofolate synthase family protein [Candidatus Erginobacter occultus]|nr:folylpolyglutamate synthase/dihydrofolate synthase family protein [Candidatus Erginobacter occultus]